jgi:hypothetical protein
VRLEVTVMLGDPQDPIVGFSQVKIIHGDPEASDRAGEEASAAYVLDCVAETVRCLDEAREDVGKQAAAIGARR